MRALILGVGDAFTCRSYGTSALVEGPEGLVLLDCPDLVHRALQDASRRSGWRVTARDVPDVIITHLHGDHCNGLESYGFLHRMWRRDDPALPRPRVHATRAVLDRLWERLAPAMDAPFADGAPSTLADYFDTRELDPDAPATIAGLTVRCRRTLHPIPTIGLRFEHGGVALGWSGDTAWDPAHIDWLASADVIVHEANIGSVHTPIERLNGLPADVRRRMRLIHLPDDFDDACTDILIAREGDVLVP